MILTILQLIELTNLCILPKKVSAEKYCGIDSMKVIKFLYILSWVHTVRFLLHKNLNDYCGNYRSCYLVDAAVCIAR